MNIRYEEKDFYLFAQRLADASNTSVVKWWEIFYEVIIRYLYLSGSVYLPNIGWLTLKHKDALYYKRKRADGQEESVILPERNLPVFKPDDDFVNDVNMLGVTSRYRQRMKNGALTARDKERERRGREILGDNYYAMIREKIDFKEAVKQNFESTLKSMRKNYEEELEAHEEEINEE